MASVEVTPRAAADVDEILLYLHGQGGRRVADRQQAAFRAAIRLLSEHPEIGRRRPEIARDLRLITVRPYLVLYRYDSAAKTAFVLRVLHSRRRTALDAP